MILVKEGKMRSIAKKQDWDNPEANHHSLTRMRKAKELPHYHGRPIGKAVTNGFYHNVKDLEELWKIKFDLKLLDSDYFVKVDDPENQGFTYIPEGKSIDDFASQE